MRDPEPGFIVSVPDMVGLFLVLRVDPKEGSAILLSRDGKGKVVRGVPIERVQIIAGQMLAWTNRSRHDSPIQKPTT